MVESALGTIAVLDPTEVGGERMMGATTAVRRDLEVQGHDRWRRWRVPRGWRPVADLCLEVRRDLPEVAESITRTIEEEVPGYRDSGVPRDDLYLSVERTLEDVLLGIAERRDPTPEEVERRAALGARRAEQGMPVEVLTRGVHVGYREIWHVLRDRGREARAPVSEQLLDAATTLFTWTNTITDALGRTHAEAMRSLALRDAGLRQRLLALVLNGDEDSEEAVTLARSLGFDTLGWFQTCVAVTVALDGSEAPRLQAACEQLVGRIQVVAQSMRLVVIAQDGDGAALGEAVGAFLPEATVAVGMRRRGLDGARASLGDAERAAALAAGSGVVHFEDVWPWAILHRDLGRVEPLMERAVEAADEFPHLAETVRRYADCGSVADAGRQLGIHANTVSYRLERWAELTGWDPRDFEGLLRSQIALRLHR